MTPDIDSVAAFIREAAEVEVLPRFRQLADGDIREKAPGDLVTVADLAVEAMLERELTALVLGSLVVGEEAVHDRPELIERLAGGDAPVWIIDPIDGTTNFSEGDPLFVIQVAYAQGGKTRAAWIFDPVRGIMATAEEGSGALLDGRRATVSPAPPVEAMKGALYANPKRPGLSPDFAHYRKRDGGYRRCVGQEYLSMVSGETHFALFTRLLPWDHAAGVHLHAEAGGHGALIDGSPYHPGLTEGYILLAPDPETWERLHGMFIAL